MPLELDFLIAVVLLAAGLLVWRLWCRDTVIRNCVAYDNGEHGLIITGQDCEIRDCTIVTLEKPK